MFTLQVIVLRNEKLHSIFSFIAYCPILFLVFLSIFLSPHMEDFFFTLFVYNFQSSYKRVNTFLFKHFILASLQKEISKNLGYKKKQPQRKNTKQTKVRKGRIIYTSDLSNVREFLNIGGKLII